VNKVMTFLLLISLSWFLIVFSVYLKIKSYGYALEGTLKDFYVEESSLMKVKPFIDEGKIEEAELNGYKIYKENGKIILKKIIE